MSALGVLRDHVIAPTLGGIHGPYRGRKPSTWTEIDHDDDTLRVDTHTLFSHLGIAAAA